MINIKKIKAEIETTQSIELITEALGDIATAKLKKTRASIEHTVSYFKGISNLYRTVKSISMRTKRLRPLPQRKTNGKTVCILLTANSRLYGGLDTELVKFYGANTANLDCDRIVAGIFGSELLGAMEYPKKFEKNFFKKDSPDILELQSLAKKVFFHERILVFYSRFKTLLNQEPFISDISTSYLAQSPVYKAPFHYIMEPEVDKILLFFDAQVTYLFLQSIFLEVDLSRLAARMISMNQAQENAVKILKTQKKELLRFKKDLINLQILENYSSMMGSETR